MNKDRKITQGPVRAVRWMRKTAIIDAVGDIDLSTCPQFQQSLLLTLDEQPKRLIVNLADVAYMDSSGVATLVKVLRKVRAIGASMALVGMNDRVRSIFEITKLDTFFEIHPTEKEAMA